MARGKGKDRRWKGLVVEYIILWWVKIFLVSSSLNTCSTSRIAWWGALLAGKIVGVYFAPLGLEEVDRAGGAAEGERGCFQPGFKGEREQGRLLFHGNDRPGWSKGSSSEPYAAGAALTKVGVKGPVSDSERCLQLLGSLCWISMWRTREDELYWLHGGAQAAPAALSPSAPLDPQEGQYWTSSVSFSEVQAVNSKDYTVGCIGFGPIKLPMKKALLPSYYMPMSNIGKDTWPEECQTLEQGVGGERSGSVSQKPGRGVAL
ncbi:hypothetical protein K439DRAFT_1619492 [Ramaria rubella]|nr:hypothetical protein K439DRAFT_1619492 [Ramaria rubella]